MKKSRFSDAEIMSILRQAEGGVPVSDLCRELSVVRVFGAKGDLI